MLVKGLKKQPGITLDVCFTGQHKEMVLPLIDFFDIPIHHSLNIMRPNQTLSSLSSLTLELMESYLNEASPDIIFVQGDTTTAMCAALSAFYKKIKIGHIEAGLRTFNMSSPFPEEFNRQVISKIADLHFAPTQSAKDNLINENISPDKIFITGNTVIDALLYTQEKAYHTTEIKSFTELKPYILITGHRRENFGDGFENICSAIKSLALKFPEYNFIYPVHLNPNVQAPVHRILNNQKNVYLIPPLNYLDFVALLSECYFVMTDSGGIQEEAPSLGKPVLVMRDTTEREEAVTAGVAVLVGTQKEDIINYASRLIEDKKTYEKMSSSKNPFGDGTASDKIIFETIKYLKGK